MRALPGLVSVLAVMEQYVLQSAVGSPSESPLERRDEVAVSPSGPPDPG